MGFLAEYLLDRQMERKGCKPFWKHIGDMRLRWEDILKLLPKLKQGLDTIGIGICCREENLPPVRSGKRSVHPYIHAVRKARGKQVIKPP